MGDLGATRSVLRIVHNAIFFWCIMSGVVVSVCNRQGLPAASYILRLLLACALLVIFFLYTDFILGSSEKKNFMLFTGQLILGIALVGGGGGYCMGPFSVIRAMLIFLCVIMSGMAFYEQSLGKPAFRPTFLVIPVYILVFLLGKHLGDGAVMALAVAAEIAGLMVFVTDHELSNLEFSIKQVKDRAFVPTDTIRKQNLLQLGRFLLPTAALTGLCFLFPYSKQLADFLTGILVFITRTVINLLLKTSHMMPEDSESDGPQGVFGQIPTQEMEKLSWLWDLIFGIATVLMILVLLWAAVSIVRAFLKRFKQSGFVSSEEVSEFLDPGEEKKKRRAQSDEIRFFDRSPEAMVRRMYRRFIKKHPGAKEIGRADTPRELETKALGEKRRNYLRLHEIYEKARYSPQGCSREDASEAAATIRGR